MLFGIGGNDGSFIPGSVQAAIERDAPDTNSRNPFLAQAMVSLGMIDTIGSGIKKMFIAQRKRFFPMPDYDLSDQKVKVQIHGKVLDLKYARLLAQNEELSLYDIILLDRVQKKEHIPEEQVRLLKRKGLIEGRKPNLHISANLAEITDKKAAYIKNRGFKDAHYKKMILEYLDKYQVASKQDVINLLLDVLPAVLDEQQKQNKIRNILYAMSKRDETIVNSGSFKKPAWRRNTSN